MQYKKVKACKEKKWERGKENLLTQFGAEKVGTSEVCKLNEWRLTWVPRREVPAPKQRDLRPPKP
jgi:hypothetical protein